MPKRKRSDVSHTEGPSRKKARSEQDSGTDQELLGNAAVQEQLTNAGSPVEFPSRTSYNTGQHGAKGREQSRLSKASGHKVSGATHESEHTVGYEPLAQTTGLDRKKGRGAKIEKNAPAYQESKPMHRAHIGTGTRGTPDASGFDSGGYRDTQRNLVEGGHVSDAVQINQLGYAFLEDEGGARTFQDETGWQREAADDSFGNMVTQMDEMTYGDGEQNRSVPVAPIDQVEMLLARDAARTGEWPEREQMATAWDKVGWENPYPSDQDSSD